LIQFQNLPDHIHLDALENWLNDIAQKENCRVDKLLYHFVDDDEILKVNRDYLQHDYYTDIITFDYSEGQNLSGEMFISLDTVESNAQNLGQDFSEELQRVIVHGLLHLIGYGDKSDKEAAEMRQKEDFCLNLRPKKLKNS